MLLPSSHPVAICKGAGTTSEDWMVREMDLIVHGIIEAELEGQYSGPQIPFEELRK